MGDIRFDSTVNCRAINNIYISSLKLNRSEFGIKMIGMENMARYASPVNPAIFAHLTFVLMAIGLFFTAWFFVYEVTCTKFTRDRMKELLISVVASIFMGLGSHFVQVTSYTKNQAVKN